MLRPLTVLLAVLLAAGSAFAADPVESDYYHIQPIPNPDKFVLEVGALEYAPDDVIYAATRRGEVYRLTGACGPDLSATKISLFAQGMHETLGAAWRDGSLYVQQRPEITRLKDEDGDGCADVFETVSDQWALTGDYHEYAFSSRPDKNGDIWSVLCLTGSGTSYALWRGWAVKTSPDGKTIPVCSGVRSPGGIGFNADGDVFYTDNQGPWNASSSLKWLRPGGFMGHGDTLKWHAYAPDMLKPEAPKENSRSASERERNPLYIPPAIMLPHGRIGASPTAIICDTTGGKFGPFKNQLFIGEQCYSNIARVSLEKVDGLYQGVVFPFVKGFASGPIGMVLTPEGQMFVGGSDRGWGPAAVSLSIWTASSGPVKSLSRYST